MRLERCVYRAPARLHRLAGLILVVAGVSCSETPDPFEPNPPSVDATLTLRASGTGQGSVRSASGTINCTLNAGAASGQCSATLPASFSSFSLTATATTGSQFVRWSGACQGTDPVSCIVPRSALPTTITAEFSTVTSATALLLPVSPVQQSLAFWCWLASGEMIFRYYGIPPVNLVNYQCGVIGIITGPASPCFFNCQLCNTGAPSIQTVANMLVAYPQLAQAFLQRPVRQLRVAVSGAALSDAQMVAELDQRRPLLVGISPSGSFKFPGQASEHAVVIAGYARSGGGVSFYVNDPWPYDAFPGQTNPYLAGGGVRAAPGQFLISSTALRQRLALRETIYGIQ